MKFTVCPQCGHNVKDLPDVRCPRCNQLLLAPCNGNCSSCKQDDTCKDK